MPIAASCFDEALAVVAGIYRAAGQLLQERGRLAGVADEGGYWPLFDSNEQALQTLTDSLHDATPQLLGTLDGVANLSRALNKRDEALEELLAHAKRVTDTLAQRAGQVNQLITDGNMLFAALDERRQALSNLIAGIDDVSRQISGFVADNKREFKPALDALNAVLDNLLARKEHIGEALRRLRALGQTDDQVFRLDGDWSEFTPAERAQFTVARQLAASPIVLTDAEFAAALKLTGPREMVQLVSYVTTRASFNRITEAAGLQIEK